MFVHLTSVLKCLDNFLYDRDNVAINNKAIFSLPILARNDMLQGGDLWTCFDHHECGHTGRGTVKDQQVFFSCNIHTF